jgi:hypothetical protein
VESDQFGSFCEEDAGRWHSVSAPPRIFVGDLVRALSLPGLTEGETWSAIAGLLGFSWAKPDDQASKREEAPPPKVTKTESSRDEKTALPEEVASDQQIGDLIEFEFERSTAPSQAVVVEKTPDSPVRAVAPLRFVSLFDPLWERGIVIEAVGVPCAEGDLAIIEAVKLFARGDPLRDLPTERIQSVSKGCQVLIDNGLGMQPFERDSRQIVKSISRAVGAERTSVLTFVDCPTVGVMSENYRYAAYAAPDNGAMVLAVSDLCSGGPRGAIREAEPEDWLSVAKSIRDAGSSLVILNPYSPDRWPVQVANCIPVLHWDVSTRAATVRQTRRKIRR